MRYPWPDSPQTLEYLVAHCVESAGGTAIHFQHDLLKKGLPIDIGRVSSALQRLKRKGIVQCQGTYWSICA